MIEIYPILSHTECEAVCSRLGLNYMADGYLYCAAEQDQILSAILFRVNTRAGEATVCAKASRGGPREAATELTATHAMLCFLARMKVKTVTFEKNKFPDCFLRSFGANPEGKLELSRPRRSNSPPNTTPKKERKK